MAKDENYISREKQEKIDTVKSLSDTVSSAKSIVFTDYSGLKHKQLEELRKQLKPVQGKYMITKNTLLIKSFGELGEQLKTALTSTTATLFANEDEVGPLKILTKFFKDAGIGKVKGGLLGTRILSEDEVKTLSSLPSKPELLGRLVGQLQAPISGLHYALSWNLNRLAWALNAVREKKQ